MKDVFADEEMTTEEKALFDTMSSGAPAQAPQDAPEPDAAPVIEADTQEAPEAVETPEKANDSEDDKPAPARDKSGKFTQQVPHKALHAERQEHKKTKASLDQERQTRELYAQRMDALIQKLDLRLPEPVQAEKPKAELPNFADPATLIDPDSDFIGALKQTQDAQRQILEARRQEEQARGQQEYRQKIAQTFRESMSIFEQQEPLFKQAVAHAVQVQHNVLRQHGIEDEVTRVQMIENDLVTMTEKALRERRNPAEILFGIAQAYGWQRPAAAPSQAQPTEELSSAAQKLQQVSRSMKAAGPSLSSVPSTGGQIALTAAQIAAMSEDEFDALQQRIDQQFGKGSFARRFLGA